VTDSRSSTRSSGMRDAAHRSGSQPIRAFHPVRAVRGPRSDRATAPQRTAVSRHHHAASCVASRPEAPPATAPSRLHRAARRVAGPFYTVSARNLRILLRECHATQVDTRRASATWGYWGRPPRLIRLVRGHDGPGATTQSVRQAHWHPHCFRNGRRTVCFTHSGSFY
jgi:hypothetical protein